MREIKFRVWDSLRRVYLNKKDIAIDNLGNIFVFEGCDDNNADLWHVRILSDPDNERYILEQFTGLKDKNGVEIYEGDVVAVVDPFSIKGVLHEVVYYNAAYWFKPIKRFSVEWGDSPVAGAFSGCEAVGNIHENPELLEE